MIATRTNRRSEPFSQHREHDHFLREAAISVLKSSGYSAVAKLDCRVDQGVVEIAGVVPNFHMMQVALAAIQRLAAVRGIHGIRNKVEVA